MSTTIDPRASVLRLSGLALVGAFALAACGTTTSEEGPSEASAGADASPSPEAKTMCESGADLAVDVAFLRSIDVSEDGLLSLIVGVDAALGEAQMLGTLTVAEYQPLVADVVVSLQDLRDIAEELEQDETVGAAITTVGEAVTAVGESMEALGTQLREPCPEEAA